MNKLISVVVTCYNHEDYIEQCLQSIFKQTYSNIELFIINDGSTDNSATLIESCLNSSPFERTEYIFQENQGICITRNKALDMITGEYLLFVDSDNFLEPDYIEKLKLVAEEKNADIVYAALRNPETGEYVIQLQNFDLELMFHGNFMDNCSLIRTSCIGEVRYDLQLNRKKLVDYDFLLTLLTKQQAVAAPCQDTYLNYRVLENSISEHGNVQKYNDAYVYIMLKHGNTKYGELAHAGLVDYLNNNILPVWFNNQYLTVYYSTEEGFIDEYTDRFPLKKSDKFSLFIDDTIEHIRLDFSDLPIFVSTVKLVSPTYKTELLPVQSNGYSLKNGYGFGEMDPQILFDVRSYRGEELSVYYEVETNPVALVKTLSDSFSKIGELNQKIRQSDQKIHLQRLELNRLQEIEEMYHMIIGSRRWIIPTKIINFFRRKK